MQTFGVLTEDVIIILSKEAILSEKSNLLEEAVNKKSVQNFAGAKYCSGVLVYDENRAVLRLLNSSPQKLFKQIKTNKYYLR